MKIKEELKEKLNTPQDAFKYILQRCFNDPELSEVASDRDLAYVCHRVVHGGDYQDAVEINDETLHHLEDLEDLAPLYVEKMGRNLGTGCKDNPKLTKSIALL